jgi:diguanylate cyclase (GGDEF)-like protein
MITPKLFLFILVISLLILLFLRGKRKGFFKKYIPKIEELQENINLLGEELKAKNEALKTLPQRAEKLFALAGVIDKFTALIKKERIYEFMVENLGFLFPQVDNLLLFILQKDDHLELVHSLKKKARVIKEKRGDIIDWWVLRYNQSLIVEDFREDFRFDHSRSISYKERGILSFISSPISLGERVCGLVRLESSKRGEFNLDDLRLLRIFCDVSAAVLERADLFERISELATKDMLTGLFLRNIFLERSNEEITRAKLTNTKLALGILDIDNFKKINDTYGHGVGDLVLRKTAQILRTIIGDAGNMISRFGGEEFIFFIVHTHKAEAKKIAEKIRKRISTATINFRRRSINFTASLGVVMYPEDGKEYLELIEKADALLYRAKREGKNRVCFTS